MTWKSAFEPENKNVCQSYRVRVGHNEAEKPQPAAHNRYLFGVRLQNVRL
jgi:hypothetical protein